MPVNVAPPVALADDAFTATKKNAMELRQQRANLLLIDDDRDLGTMLADYFRAEQLDLTVTNSGEEGLTALSDDDFHLLVLDIMLPGMNGLDVLKTVRQASNIPVIMLTARGDDVDRIIGLEFGADDYLAKPFNPRELLARVKAILRRTQNDPAESSLLQFSGIELNSRTRTASVDGNTLELTGTEFEILRSLLQSAGEVVSKESLSECALGRRLLPYDRSIDTHISNLRGKLEKTGPQHVTIRNQRGVGYSLIPRE